MKQFNIICENGHDNHFFDKDDPPVSCSVCSIAFEDERVIEVEIVDNKEITGLTIIYQITQERLEISTLHKVILGREYFGAEMFSKILYNGNKVISRKHCSIEFRDGNFYLLDEGSKNGTFYGVNKLDCKNASQIIEDKGIFYIGEEAFIAQVNYKETELGSEIDNIDSNTETSKKIKKYKCKKCGKESDEFVSKCSGCGFKNTLIEVYE